MAIVRRDILGPDRGKLEHSWIGPVHWGGWPGPAGPRTRKQLVYPFAGEICSSCPRSRQVPRHGRPPVAHPSRPSLTARCWIRSTAGGARQRVRGRRTGFSRRPVIYVKATSDRQSNERSSLSSTGSMSDTAHHTIPSFVHARMFKPSTWLSGRDPLGVPGSSGQTNTLIVCGP